MPETLDRRLDRRSTVGSDLLSSPIEGDEIWRGRVQERRATAAPPPVYHSAAHDMECARARTAMVNVSRTRHSTR